MPIQLLPSELIGQIAAGEVVERPASVVKELVENSLDAGATRIRVDIRAGGRELIRVSDDGCGIPAEELRLALAQHATSKLASASDLARIATLGFRGEALGSIAAVATVTISSRARGSAAGYEIEGRGVERTAPRPVSRAEGTVVTVRDLFVEVPARLKFLRAASTEQAAIARFVGAYALARAGVRFELFIEGRRALATDGSGERLNAIVAVYGAEVAAHMLPLDPDAAEVPGVRVSGYVSAPSLHRAHRQGITLFVNGRWVQNRAIGFALEEAYHSLLMIGRHPIAAIDIELPPQQVDVNVHPTKSEVRFVDERAVGRALSRSARAALLKLGPVAVPSFALGGHATLVATPDFQSRFATGSARWPDEPPDGAEPPAHLANGRGSAPSSLHGTLSTSSGVERHVDEAPAGVPSTGGERLPPLRVLGQVAASYIIAEGPEGMFLIDQHAAHERILLDRLLLNARQATPDTQLLLEPLVLELTPAQCEALELCSGELGVLGFTIEPFGGYTYAVRAIPAALAAAKPKLDDLLVAVLEEAARGGQDLSLLERFASVSACHSAIRANQSLTIEEMRALLGQLERTSLPRTCAHGRPTMLQVGLGDLERQFGRHV